MPPSYDLANVKRLVRASRFRINPDALQDVIDDFGWSDVEVVKVLLALNSRLFRSDPTRNHFYKTEPHRSFPNTMMDYYKIANAYQGEKVYTHFYIHPSSGLLVISSFHELDL